MSIVWTKLKKAQRKICIPIYDLNIIISFDPMKARKDVCMTKEEVSQYEACVSYTNQISCFVFFWPDRYDVNTLAHEMTHVAYKILDICCIEHDPKNHEAFAYLLGWLCEETQKFYRLLVKKERITC